MSHEKINPIGIRGVQKLDPPEETSPEVTGKDHERVNLDHLQSYRIQVEIVYDGTVKTYPTSISHIHRILVKLQYITPQVFKDAYQKGCVCKGS